jgi:hypothetical protein
MKYLNTFFLFLFALLLLPLQESLPQELPYDEGTVWSIIFIRTKPGMSNEYFRHFATNLRGEYEEAKRQGLILSYKLLFGNAANKDDWDLLIMIEYKNMAAFDGVEEKWETISAKLDGSQEQQKLGYTKRSEMRETFGTKIVREIILK